MNGFSDHFGLCISLLPLMRAAGVYVIRSTGVSDAVADTYSYCMSLATYTTATLLYYAICYIMGTNVRW